MLTAMLGGLAPSQATPANDANGDGIIDSFFERLTDDPIRLLVAAAAMVITFAVMWNRFGSFWMKLVVILTSLVVGWLFWGLMNKVWSDYPQPLFRVDICLDYFSFGSWPLIMLMLIPVGVFAYMFFGRRGPKTIGRFLAASLVFFAIWTVMALLQFGWRKLQENKDEIQLDTTEEVVVELN